MSENNNGGSALAVSGIAAVLALISGLGPPAQVIRIGGASARILTSLDPYRPLLIVGALVALFFAAGRVFRPTEAGMRGESYSEPPARKAVKAVFWIIFGLIGIAIGFPFLLPVIY